MKKQILPCLVFLMSSFCGLSVFSAPNNFEARVVNFSCPAIAPADFHIASATPTSITLDWTDNQANVYYFLSGYDNTGSTSLPSVVTQNQEYTYNSLTPGHNYTFYIGASWCAEGPIGDQGQSSGNTGIIIVDLIALTDGCTPTRPLTPPLNESIYVHIMNSTETPPDELDNAYIAEFSYSTYDFKFGLGFLWGSNAVYSDKFINESDKFQFDYTDNTEKEVVCMYNGDVPLFTVEFIEATVVQETATLEFIFLATLTDYAICNPYGSLIHDGDEETCFGKVYSAELAERSSPEEMQLKRPSPNPFGDFVTYRYCLYDHSPVDIRLYDATGHLVKVMNDAILQAPGVHEVQISGTGLSDGIYFLSVQTGTQRQVHTLIKRE